MANKVKITKNRIVVDTDVVSYFLKEDERRKFYEPYFRNRTLAVSFMTVAELYFWAYNNSWGQSRITELENKIKNYVVLPYDVIVCMRWAEVRNQRDKDGAPK